MFFAFIAQQGAPSGGAGIMGFLPFILILVILYFLMIRPQMKKQKDHTTMLSSLRKNDEVITAGGLHGRIVQVNEKDPTIQLQIAKGIIVTVERSSVAGKSSAGSSNPGSNNSAGLIQPGSQHTAGRNNPSESRTAEQKATGATKGNRSRRNRPRRGRRYRPPKQDNQSSSPQDQNANS